MKTCTRCLREQPLAAFSRRNARGDLHSHCKDCVKAASRAHYLATSTVQRRYDGSFDEKAYFAEKNRAHKEKLTGVKKGCPCTDCGRELPAPCMEFDRVQPGKVQDLSQMRNYRVEAVEAELAKCELVCANCHRVRTASRRAPTHHTGRYAAKTEQALLAFRVWMTELKAAPCTDCGGHFNAVAMDFDHVRGVKVTGISAMWSWDRNKVLAELAKTELVCACCHRLRTEARRAQKAA